MTDDIEFSSLSGTDPIETWFTEMVVTIEMARPRSAQVAIGPSELGNPCDRAIAFKSAGARAVHYSDPLKAIFGTALHEWFGHGVEHSPMTRRYLIEHPVEYRGIGGSVDIFDRWHGRCIDLKTTSLSKIKRIKYKGVTDGHRVQAQTYAAGLVEQGEDVRSVTLLYIPTDGTLADVYAASLPVDRSVADEAVDRLERIQNRLYEGDGPQEFAAHPSPLCGWCPAYRPGHPLTSRSCPGGTAEAGVDVASEAIA